VADWNGIKGKPASYPWNNLRDVIGMARRKRSNRCPPRLLLNPDRAVAYSHCRDYFVVGMRKE